MFTIELKILEALKTVDQEKKNYFIDEICKGIVK